MRARELECGSKRRDVMGGKEEKEGRQMVRFFC